MLNIDLITPTTPVTFTQYYELLVNADWFHSFSDDISVSSLGCGREGQLHAIAKRHSFCGYMFMTFIQRRDNIIKKTNTDTRDIKDMYNDWVMTQGANL